MEIVNFLFFIASALFIIFYFILFYIKNSERKIFEEIQVEVINIVKNNFDTFEIFNKINTLISRNEYSDSIVSKVIKFLISNRDVSNLDLGVIRNVIFDYGGKKFWLLSYISLAPNIFLLLGIIGTISGLRGTIESLSLNLKNVSVIEPKAVYSLLAGTVMHIKDAFNYSLFGIIFSIVSFILLRVFIRSYNDFLFQIEEIVFNLIAPLILHKTYLTQLENIEKTIKSLESVLDLYKQKLNETLVLIENKIEQINGIFTDNTSKLRDIFLQLENGLNKSNDFIIQNVKLINDEYKNLFIRIKQDLSEINAFFEYNIRLIKDIIDNNLKEELKIFVSTLQNLEQQFKNINNNLHTIDKQLLTILEDIKNYNQNFVGISNSQISTIEGYKNIFEEKMKNVIEKIEYLIGLLAKLQEYENFDREERIKAIKYELRETLRGFLIDFKEEIKKSLK